MANDPDEGFARGGEVLLQPVERRLGDIVVNAELVFPVIFVKGDEVRVLDFKRIGVSPRLPAGPLRVRWRSAAFAWSRSQTRLVLFPNS